MATSSQINSKVFFMFYTVKPVQSNQSGEKHRQFTDKGEIKSLVNSCVKIHQCSTGGKMVIRSELCTCFTMLPCRIKVE